MFQFGKIKIKCIYLLLFGKGALMTKKNALIAFLIAIIVIVAGVVAYVQGKHYVTRKEVKDYLLTEKGYSESDIVEFESNLGNLSGDSNWLVFVKIKGDKGYYYYYYDRDNDQVILESYGINGHVYGDPSEVPNE